MAATKRIFQSMGRTASRDCNRAKEGVSKAPYSSNSSTTKATCFESLDATAGNSLWCRLNGVKFFLKDLRGFSQQGVKVASICDQTASQLAAAVGNMTPESECNSSPSTPVSSGIPRLGKRVYSTSGGLTQQELDSLSVTEDRSTQEKVREMKAAWMQLQAERLHQTANQGRHGCPGIEWRRERAWAARVTQFG